jgi:PilZ domain-containing protein
VLESAATLTIIGGGESCRATTRDISEGGMAVAGLPEAWGPTTQVEIRCEGGLLPKPLTASGVIAWRHDGLAGITFTEVDPDSVPAVADYVATHRG